MNIFQTSVAVLLTIFVTESTVINIFNNGGTRRPRPNKKYQESARKKFYLNTLQRYQKYLEQLAILQQSTTHEAERYSPNVGYEPYWQGGDWVVQEAVTTTPGEITTTVPLICGVECNQLYRNSGPICVSKPGYSYISQSYYCRGFVYLLYTEGKGCNRPDPLDYFEYYTFDNFCVYLQEQCKNASIYASYYFAHVGECIPHKNSTAQYEWAYLYSPADMLQRLSKWVTGLSKRFVTMDLTTAYPAWYTDPK